MSPRHSGLLWGVVSGVGFMVSLALVARGEWIPGVCTLFLSGWLFLMEAWKGLAD